MRTTRSAQQTATVKVLLDGIFFPKWAKNVHLVAFAKGTRESGSPYHMTSASMTQTDDRQSIVRLLLFVSNLEG